MDPRDHCDGVRREHRNDHASWDSDGSDRNDLQWQGIHWNHGPTEWTSSKLLEQRDGGQLQEPARRAHGSSIDDGPGEVSQSHAQWNR